MLRMSLKCSFEQIGCMVLSDLKEVLDDDLTVRPTPHLGFPPASGCTVNSHITPLVIFMYTPADN